MSAAKEGSHERREAPRIGGLFDGVGLLAYGLHLAGFEHTWLCESDEWRRSILAKRWPGVPVHHDVRAVGVRSACPVDLVAGGFPCKGASSAGRREGFGHPETVLWREMRRIVGELRPRYVLVENVANILALHDGAVWGEVLGDLVALGYDTTWDCVPAAAVGAPHLRDRVFAVATDADGENSERDGGLGRLADRRADAARGGGDASYPDLRRGQGRPLGDGSRTISGEHLHTWHDADRRGVPVGVDWGEYGPAIGRWETVAGPAPEPLLRRVDARPARKLVRSRLSALGDGVQVQVGYLAGMYIRQLEREGRKD